MIMKRQVTSSNFVRITTIATAANTVTRRDCMWVPWRCQSTNAFWQLWPCGMFYTEIWGTAMKVFYNLYT